MKSAEWKAYYDHRKRILGHRKWTAEELKRLRSDASPYVSVTFKGQTYRVLKTVVGAKRISGSKAQPDPR